MEWKNSYLHVIRLTLTWLAYQSAHQYFSQWCNSCMIGIPVDCMVCLDWFVVIKKIARDQQKKTMRQQMTISNKYSKISHGKMIPTELDWAKDSDHLIIIVCHVANILMGSSSVASILLLCTDTLRGDRMGRKIFSCLKDKYLSLYWMWKLEHNLKWWKSLLMSYFKITGSLGGARFISHLSPI